MCLVRNPFIAVLWLFIFNFGYTKSGVISGPFHCVDCAIRCDQPSCQSSLPPPPPSGPIYGGQPPPPPPSGVPPPPSGPIYGGQPPPPSPPSGVPPPSDPSYGVPPAPPPPSRPLYGVPPPPLEPSYGVTYPPPPYLQCCNYPSSSTYTGLPPYGSASKLTLSFLPFMVLAFTYSAVL